MKIEGETRRPMRAGTVTVVDMQTGAKIDTRRNAMTLMPPAPDKCQECAVDHVWDQPHNRDSLYYQMRFHATHGRWPTWTDAMAHCTPAVRELWRRELIAQHEGHGLPVPDDLRGDSDGPSDRV